MGRGEVRRGEVGNATKLWHALEIGSDCCCCFLDVLFTCSK